ncbi:MAG TPA: extracellular solute-binding protein [Aliidongia sp.]|nr:extracellular solute-binding protein [Aliidongia sp.]
MVDLTRRDAIKIGAGAALAVGTPGLVGFGPAHAQSLDLKPEAGAKLKVLRWKRFVATDETVWLENTKKYSAQSGIDVHVDSENWEDVRPKAATAAQVGSGPDIIITTFDDPHKFPNKLVDLTDLATYLGGKYGGWYDVCERYSKRDGKWIGLPMGAAGNAMVYRIGNMRKAGFEEFPKDFPGFLKLCQALKANGTPPGFALGHATGDANAWTHWCLWSHGGKMVNEKNEVVLDSPETVAALEYAAELYKTFVPGVLSWLDPSNNKAFLAGDCSLTANGISIYYSAKTSDDPTQKALAEDIGHAHLPIGPLGRPATLSTYFQAVIFNYSKYPNAAKDYLRFMWEKEQYIPWQAASIGYVTQPLKAYESNPIWTEDPKHTPYRDAMSEMLDNGYSGQLGAASASSMADFIIVDMFAGACQGQVSPKEAAKTAAEQAKRYYKA